MQCMDVAFINFKHHRIVVDGVFVLPELGEAIGPVVVRFYVVVALAVLDLKRVVFDRALKLVHLAINQPPVRVNNRVCRVQFNRSIEVKDGVFKPIIIVSLNTTRLTCLSSGSSRHGCASKQRSLCRAESPA